eukprot:422864-Pelagomonas_calceolata.AAC.3
MLRVHRSISARAAWAGRFLQSRAVHRLICCFWTSFFVKEEYPSQRVGSTKEDALLDESELALAFEQAATGMRAYFAEPKTLLCRQRLMSTALFAFRQIMLNEHHNV